MRRWTIYTCPACQGREIAPPYGGPCPGCGSAMESAEVLPIEDLQQLIEELEGKAEGYAELRDKVLADADGVGAAIATEGEIAYRQAVQSLRALVEGETDG